ncbi:MAG: MlaD family protein [Candidatus Hydrogenedentota bacterium]
MPEKRRHGEAGNGVATMKHTKIEKIIIVTFSSLGIGLGLYYAWSSFGSMLPWETASEVRFIIPSSMGISPGHPVMNEGAPERSAIGTVRNLRAVSDGIMITVSIEPGRRLKRGTRVVVRPLGALREAAIELSTGNPDEPDLILPAIVPGEIQPGPPDNMLEPAPRWPA